MMTIEHKYEVSNLDLFNELCKEIQKNEDEELLISILEFISEEIPLWENRRITAAYNKMVDTIKKDNK
jgi:hypothetical protein